MRRLSSAAALLVALAVAAPAAAQLHAEVVVSGLSSPVAFVQDPSQPNVQFIAQQGGRIRILQNGTLLEQDFLDLTSAVTTSWIGGLLGMAFPPDYAASGRFYVNFTDQNNNTVIARFKRSETDPLVADPGSRFNFLWPDGNTFIFQPYGDHNGGHLAFGPDGYLWIALGDGGGTGDPDHRAQDPQTLLGKLLRLDVNVSDFDAEGYDVPGDNPFVEAAGVLPEIWAFGLRNPWRYSFDDPARGGTGALILADVGQDAWEEINYEPIGNPGRNYGWRLREGANDYNLELPEFFGPLTDPVHQYPRSDGHSVTGGFVYRGAALPGYHGRYFFGDFIFGRIWSIQLGIDPDTGSAYAVDLIEHTAELGGASDLLVSFGVDAEGELYLVSLGRGEVSRIVAGPPPPPPGPPPVPGGPCTTPDPFASLGGGTCVNGGWIPPVFGPTPEPPPAPTPEPAPTAPPTPSSGCITPDPFVSLGGGVCVNGGWFPPGAALPSPSPTPVPAPAPPPLPSPGACTTPDPFASLGGGTCVNGNWFPPGVSVPIQAPEPPVSGGCTTPNPFAIFGAGYCVNGEWQFSPPPFPSPTPNPTPTPAPGCTTPDPFAGIPGLVGLCINGGWIPIAIGS